jgi:hypothetical protein
MLGMKHIPQDKYNVAWFTLAECIARKEKVRALGVYRLLAHSIEDGAFRYQLEGDILLAFQDDAAVQKYKEAARLYKQSGRILETIAVYEHLRLIEPDELDNLKILVQLYSSLSATNKVKPLLKQLFQSLMQQGKFDTAAETLKQLDQQVAAGQTSEEHQQIVFAYIREDRPVYKVLEFLRLAVNDLLQSSDGHELQKFMATLEALDTRYYQEACTLLQKEPTK